MQSVAAEMNHSETAFAHPRDDGDWNLRWFTPKVEVKLCGHATLATVHALNSDGLIDGSVRFHCLSGALTAQVGEEITLDFPAAPPVEIEPPAGVAEALGAAPGELHGTGALNDLLAVFEDEAQVRALQTGFAAVAPRCDVRAGRADQRLRRDHRHCAGRGLRLRLALLRSPRGHRRGPGDWRRTHGA